MNLVLAVIPARWGSTRFPGKPLHFIAGKPLIQHVWERCRKCSRLDEILVAHRLPDGRIGGQGRGGIGFGRLADQARGIRAPSSRERPKSAPPVCGTLAWPTMFTR